MTAPSADPLRFPFGANWRRFLETVDDQIIAEAVQSLQVGLGTDTLSQDTFLDLGSGSGLFSLAAHRLGARVVSLDLDPESVACTAELKRRAGAGESHWRVITGSVLDQELLQSLGQFDVVYSWGVLHHTGALWQGLDNAARCTAVGGRLWVAIYNDQEIGRAHV